MANVVEMNDKLPSPITVVIKSEPIECNVDIKMEPPDEYEELGPVKVSSIKKLHEEVTSENENLIVKDANDSDIIVEHITVKIEPACYSSDDERDLASSAVAKCQETVQQQNNRSLRTRIKNPKKSNDKDKEYKPQKKKKKVVKEVVKKTYTNKLKRKENSYSDNVTKNIELVTITEEEREIEFRELWQARRHMRHFCGDCALGFVMEEPYLMHMKSHAPETGEFVCEICRCRSNNKEQMYKHRLRHFRRYRCSICKRVFKDKETASSHVMSEHIHETFLCGECGKGFRRPAYLKKHVEQQHTKGQRHECPVCQRVFFHRSLYNTHVRRHNEEVRNPVTQPFMCDLCSKQLKTKQALRRHLAVHERTRNVPCARCPSKFNTTKGMRLHELNKHSGDNERRILHKCPQCERECTTPALLRQHIRRMHTDRTKKYQCDECKRFYWSKGELRSHIVWSHAPSRGKRALFCCGREFRTRSRLKDHITIHHLGHERERIHKCDQCDKAFANKQVLSRHRKIHSDCTYPCPDCGVRFKCGAYVKVHQQLKHLNMTRAEIKALKQARKASNPPKGLRPLTVAPNISEIPEGLQPLTVTPNINEIPEGLRPLSLTPNINEPSNRSLSGAPNIETQDPSVRSEKEIGFETVLVKQEVDSDSEIRVPLFDLEDLQSRV